MGLHSQPNSSQAHGLLSFICNQHRKMTRKRAESAAWPRPDTPTWNISCPPFPPCVHPAVFRGGSSQTGCKQSCFLFASRLPPPQYQGPSPHPGSINVEIGFYHLTVYENEKTRSSIHASLPPLFSWEPFQDKRLSDPGARRPSYPTSPLSKAPTPGPALCHHDNAAINTPAQTHCTQLPSFLRVAAPGRGGWVKGCVPLTF